ncbi:acyltransferase family protein [Thalassobacillus sp. CUG 92003]|uniref:acyltransferase family protein n=1 Tax=Thalassobacillus sp. CUG 92003 TaxID=2736641 RepID=UPI0015E66B5D|nr:acyltransferase family protein [Thalassobacillus sp. CUG 92003]
MNREPFFDNAKLILIFIVVFGHMIQPFTHDSQFVYTLYTWIYVFHMPAFILLAGFFAKAVKEKGYIAKLSKKLVMPYLIFQFVYTMYYFFIGKEGWLHGPFYPHWSLWFLFSLFCWHVLLQWFSRLSPLIGLGIAVQLGILVGYFSDIGHTLSLSRTLVFFPFFLLGYWLTVDHMKKLQTWPVRIAGLVVMAGVAAFIVVAPEFSSGWLLGSKSYATLGSADVGGLIRVGVYLLAAVMTASVLAWMPTKQFSFTVLGQRTLYVYLLHGFFIQFFRQADWFKVDNMFDLFGLAVFAAGIVYLLSSSLVRTMSQPLIEGQAKMLKHMWSKHVTHSSNRKGPGAYR